VASKLNLVLAFALPNFAAIFYTPATKQLLNGVDCYYSPIYGVFLKATPTVSCCDWSAMVRYRYGSGAGQSLRVWRH
jgi:hypothetical protein